MCQVRRSNEGFSLLELLIVVAIILVIATIAIPSLIKSRQMANESSAVANLRTISNAEATYLSSSGGSYGDLPQLVSDRLLDDRFATGGYGGYNYSITATTFDFTATATPVSSNSGRYGYYMLPDSVIRYSTTIGLAPAGKAGHPVN